MDVVNITNITFLNAESIQEIITRINLLITIFQALGGIFIAWIILTIYRLITARKQKKMFAEIRADIKQIKRKLKIKG